MSVILNCRTCTRACKDYKALYEENLVQGELSTLAELLQYCTNLAFPADDTEGMPEHICLNCIQLLEQSYNFKRMVMESDELLRQGLQDNNNDNEYIMIEMMTDDADGEDLEEKYKPEESETIETISEVDVEYVDTELEAVEVATQDSTELETEEDSGSKLSIEYVNIKHEAAEYITECDEEEMDEEDDIVQHLEQVVVEEEEGFEVEPEEYVIQESIEEDGEGEDDDEENENDNTSESAKPIQGLTNVCEICGKGFRQLCRLRQHMQSHNNEKCFTCEVCGKKLKHLKNYKEHVITHTDLKPHQCTICNRFYRTTSSLAAHKRTHAEDKPFKCDVCGRGFAAFDHMRRHKLTHTGERPYACSLCDKAYYDSSSLRTHMVSHTGIKAFTCEICGIGLTQKSGYKKHMLVHSGEKPHKCHICGRAFTFTSNLNAHVRLHSGEKPFKCDKCPKCFPTNKRLQSHQRVHNKERLVCPTDGVNLFDRRTALIKDGQKLNNMPDMSDQQVSRSKVVVVL